MKPYKITVAYDGTDYAGWQLQKNVKSVVGMLQKVFFECFSKEIKLLGASRTDAGVHANGQVARFYTDFELNSEKMLEVWNNHLPNDILIKSLEICADDFNPRYQVNQKTYHYNIFLNRPSPLYARFGLYWPYKFDKDKFQECLQIFVGTHDFRSFCTGECDNTIRTIDEICIQFDERMNAYRVEIRGGSFLRYMIRRIIGACLKVSSTDIQIGRLKEIITSKNPHHSLPKAPASGLILDMVDYDILV